MIFSWTRSPGAVLVSTCRSCGLVVARSRTQKSVFRAQRAHTTTCIPTVQSLTRR